MLHETMRSRGLGKRSIERWTVEIRAYNWRDCKLKYAKNRTGKIFIRVKMFYGKTVTFI